MIWKLANTGYGRSHQKLVQEFGTGSSSSVYMTPPISWHLATSSPRGNIVSLAWMYFRIP